KGDVSYAAVRDQDGVQIPYWQVFVQHQLRAGEGSRRRSVFSPEAGRYVGLEVKPLFLARVPGDEPVVATLAESEYICLVRKDRADAISAAKLDVRLEPTFFDGETPPDPGETFPGQNQDWSDL